MLFALGYHDFKVFNESLNFYVKNRVWEFYEAYRKILPAKKKRVQQETREIVRVHGMNVQCDGIIINKLYGFNTKQSLLH